MEEQFLNDTAPTVETNTVLDGQPSIPPITTVQNSNKKESVIKPKQQSLAEQDYRQFIDTLTTSDPNAIFQGTEDQYRDVRPMGYNAESKTNINRNFNRYYQHSSFNRLSFNPWRDNEELYNKEGALSGDIWRATKAAVKMIPSGFISGLRSYNDMAHLNFTGADEESASEMADANVIGMSTRGGVGGFFSNIIANSGYTVGMTLEMLAEGAVGTALAAATGGTTAPITLANEANNVMKLGKAVKNIFNLTETVAKLKNFNVAKTSYNLLNKAVDFVNPLNNTIDAIKEIKTLQQSQNITNLAKISKTAAAFHRDVMMANATLSESKVEAGSVAQDMRDTLTSEFFRREGRQPNPEEQLAIENKAQEAASTTLALNLPTIYLTNKITFDPLFKSFKNLDPIKLARSGTKIIQNATTGEFEKQTLGTSLKGLLKPKTYLKGTLNYFKENLSEGLQETLQETISGAAKNYYTSQYDNETKKGNDTAKGENNSPSFINSLGSAFEEQFTSKGFETFASGFFMGGLMKPLGAGARYLQANSKRIYDKKGFEDYKAEKTRYEKNAIASLNEANKRITNLFSVRDRQLADISNAIINQNNTQLKDDSKHFYDVKNQQDWSLITNIFETGTEKQFIDRLESIKTMPAEDVEKAFPGTVGTQVLEDVNKMVDKVKYLKNAYIQVNEKFLNPFNPKKYKEDTDEHTQEFLGYRAWEDAKQQLVFHGYSMDKSLERINKLTNELLSQPEFQTIAASNVTPLLSIPKLKNEISILKTEIGTLRKSDISQSKELLKEKQSRLDNLIDFYNGIEEYRSNDPSFLSEDRINELKKQGIDTDGLLMRLNTKRLENKNIAKLAYTKILSDFTEKAGSTDIQSNALNKSFESLLDIHSLNTDVKNTADVIDLLTNPNGFIQHQQNLTKILSDIHGNRENIAEKSVKDTYKKIETNYMLNALYNQGITVNPDELEQILKGEVPDTFYDVAGKQDGIKENPLHDVFAQIIDGYHQAAGIKPVRDEQDIEKDIEAEKNVETTKEEKNDTTEKGNVVTETTNIPIKTKTKVFDYKKEFAKVKTAEDLEKVKARIEGIFGEYDKTLEYGITLEMQEQIHKEYKELENRINSNSLKNNELVMGDFVTLKDNNNGIYKVTFISKDFVNLTPTDPKVKETLKINMKEIKDKVDKNLTQTGQEVTLPEKEGMEKIKQSNEVSNNFLEDKAEALRLDEESEKLGKEKTDDNFLNNLKC